MNHDQLSESTDTSTKCLVWMCLDIFSHLLQKSTFRIWETHLLRQSWTRLLRLGLACTWHHLYFNTGTGSQNFWLLSTTSESLLSVIWPDEHFLSVILGRCICFLFNYSVKKTAATSDTKIPPIDFRLVFVKVPNLSKKHVQLVSLKKRGPWEIYWRLCRAVISFCCWYQILPRFASFGSHAHILAMCYDRSLCALYQCTILISYLNHINSSLLKIYVCDHILNLTCMACSPSYIFLESTFLMRENYIFFHRSTSQIVHFWSLHYKTIQINPSTDKTRHFGPLPTPKWFRQWHGVVLD
jgi:hypothetical protein